MLNKLSLVLVGLIAATSAYAGCCDRKTCDEAALTSDVASVETTEGDAAENSEVEEPAVVVAER